MTTRVPTIETEPRRRGRRAIASVSAVLLAGVGVTAVMLDHPGAVTPQPPRTESVTAGHGPSAQMPPSTG